jgi:hypothetical protein
MFEDRLIYNTSKFLTSCIDARISEGEITPELLRSHLISIFKCLNVGSVGAELKPIHEAFEILKLAERYMKEPPIHDDWIEEPADLDSYWTWERCITEAMFQYFKKDERGVSLMSSGGN